MHIRGLDETDIQILEILKENARTSYIDIAREVSLSHVAVKNRICALEKKGIIEKYSIIINPHRQETHISAFMDITVDARSMREAIETLKESDSVTQLYVITGSSRLHVHGLFDCDASFADFLKGTVYELPGLISVETGTIIERVKDDRNIRL